MVCSQSSTTHSISKLSRRGVVLKGETSHQLSSRCYRNVSDMFSYFISWGQRQPNGSGKSVLPGTVEQGGSQVEPLNCVLPALAGATGPISSLPCSWVQVQFWHSWLLMQKGHLFWRQCCQNLSGFVPRFTANVQAAWVDTDSHDKRALCFVNDRCLLLNAHLVSDMLSSHHITCRAVLTPSLIL